MCVLWEKKYAENIFHGLIDQNGRSIQNKSVCKHGLACGFAIEVLDYLSAYLTTLIKNYDKIMINWEEELFTT